MADVERFWCPRDGTFNLDGDGYLADPREGGSWSRNAQVLSTSDLAATRAVVMLGEMGAGKSHVLERPQVFVPSGIPMLEFNLGSYGSEDRLVREILNGEAIRLWRESAGELALVLDGFDEAQARIPHLGQVVATAISGWPADRLVLRIASRTVDWSLLLERMISEVFDTSRVVEILPLTRTDAESIAALHCEDPGALLEAVGRANASAFASRPQTLRMLAVAFDADGALPERSSDLYARGVASLADESNEGRREAGLVGSLSVAERLAVVQRVAAALTLRGATAVWTGLASATGEDDLSIEALTGGHEPTGVAEVAVDDRAVREVLRTGLFTSRGQSRYGFAHSSFADYSAAVWVASNGLTESQVRSILVGPGGRVYPQVRVMAAWLVAIAGPAFSWLATEDPESFRGEVDLPSSELRASVVDGLFARASALTFSWTDLLGGLEHPGLVDQVRPMLSDGTPDQRRLALDLARDCRLVDLRPDLVRIVLDPLQEEWIRVRAAHAVSGVAPDAQIAALVRLVREPGLRGPDKNLELLGTGLSASWPHAVSTEEALLCMQGQSARNFFGAYEAFASNLASALTDTDLEAALAWLEREVTSLRDGNLGALANAIIMLAARHMEDDSVVAALARVTVLRLPAYDGLFFNDFRDGQPALELDQRGRRALAMAIIEAADDDRVVYQLSELSPFGIGLIGRDDFDWLLDTAGASTGTVQARLGLLFRMNFDWSDASQVERFLGLDDDHPVRVANRDRVVVDLDSEGARTARESHELMTSMPPRERNQDVPLDDMARHVRELLNRAEGGDERAFVELGRALAVKANGRFTSDHHDDLTSEPLWEVLTEDDHVRVADSARRYLATGAEDPTTWLDDPGRLYYAPFAGYRALVLLLKVDRSYLEDLPAATWIDWSPVIATVSCAINGASSDNKSELLRLADAHAHDRMVWALVRSATAAVGAGGHFLMRDELDFLFDDALAQSIVSILGGTEALPSDLVAALARHRRELAVPILIGRLVDSTGEARLEAAVFLIDHDLEASWVALTGVFESDRQLALDAFGRSETVRGSQNRGYTEAFTADLYLWLHEAFPPDNDPEFDDAHMVGPREAIARWRDGLLASLRDRGTLAATEAIAAVAAALPNESWMARVQSSAMSAFATADWSPIEITQLLRLAAERRSSFVASGADLLRVVVDGLGCVQDELTGANPQSHLLWDTYSGRPKTEEEISDHLRNRLQELVGEYRLVVNREVQVRRNHRSGIPERDDLQIDAATGIRRADSVISLPVEVKGCWHDDVDSALVDQLVNQYMKDLRSSHGCYVVLWPDLASWKPPDNRLAKAGRVDRHTLEGVLDAQCETLSSQGKTIEVVHLAMDYLRPAEG